LVTLEVKSIPTAINVILMLKHAKDLVIEFLGLLKQLLTARKERGV
jgi:hypothetical protein